MSLDVLSMKIDPTDSPVSEFKDQKKSTCEHGRGVYFTYMGSKNPWVDWAPIFLVLDVPDVIKPFKFGDDRFRRFWLAEGQISHLTIDFEGCPYNTHTTVW